MSDRPDSLHRLVALLALLGLAAALVSGVVSLTQGALGRTVIVAVALAAAVAGGWYVVASRGAARLAGGVLAAAGGVAVVLVIVSFKAPRATVASGSRPTRAGLKNGVFGYEIGEY